MPHRELLEEIRKAQETSEPLEAVRLRGYMAETTPRTRALLFSLFTNASVRKLATKIPNEEKTDFLLRELRIALMEKERESQHLRPAFDPGYALQSITSWLLDLFAERQPPSATKDTASDLIGILEDAARSGDAALRALIVTAVLEHILSNKAAVDRFRRWRSDTLLKPLLEEGLSLSGGS